MNERKDQLAEVLKIETKKQRMADLKEQMQAADFWTDYVKAGELSQELRQLDDLITEFELAETDEEIAELEKLALLSGEHDDKPALVSITSGSGGTEAQDWAEMLLRMYLRYCEKRGYKATVLDISEGEEAGIKSATVEIKGPFAYGYLKAENGVHRLVRMSPFDADKARHTSFALVQVLPKLPPRSVSINPDDLRIDVYRASGKGGQGVNTTDSAVRLTHIPTGIVVAVQNERSQLQNKETAMAILQSRLELLEKEKSAERIALIKGDYREAAWGNQIRSYVLAPYQMVKDHRTNYESSNPQDVLDGNVHEFIEAGLRYLAETNVDNTSENG
jgi:peptide chain release factor 2